MNKLLQAVEWLTITAGVVMSALILWSRPGAHDPRGVFLNAGAEQRVLAATSACEPGAPPTTLAKLHAYLDGAELPTDPLGPPPPVDAALLGRGSALFARYCARCHGGRGAGNGPAAPLLTHPPANFTTGTYELRTTEHEALPADIDLFRTITRGVHGTAMPPWFALPERDRWALVAHLKTLSPEFADDEAPPPVVAQPPVETLERVVHGSEIYAKGGCASCHGSDGRGDGPASTSLAYKSGVPAHPRDFRADRFHRSSRLADIYLTLQTGLDGTPMGSFSKVLSPDDLWDVAMYVHSLSPKFTALASGVRCSAPRIEHDHDELIGIRTLALSVQPAK